jgi:Predicted membrane protein (DUF2142)
MANRRHLLRGATLTLCLFAGAALNVYRVSSWQAHGVHSPRGFQEPYEQIGSARAWWARNFGRIEVFNQFWRPMRVTLTLRGPDDAPPEGVRVKVAADRRPAGTYVLHAGWSRHDFVVSEPAPFDGRLWLDIEREQVPTDERGFAFARVQTAPIWAWGPIVRHAAVGAFLGAFLWLVWAWRARPIGVDAGDAAPAAVPGIGTLAVLATAIFLYLCWWALLRPPFQTPDERQQHLRITSILLHPWFAEPGRFALDGRYVSPLAHNQPPPIEKLPFHPDERVTAPEIVELESTPWNRTWTLEPFERVYASYPTLYYLSVFAIAQPLTEWLSLTPYQSSYLYRFVTAAFAALLWTAAYAGLRRIAETRAIAGWIVAIALLNPMLAFLSSGINADAVSFPLCTMAMLAVWDDLTRGTRGVRSLLWLLAAALVKPSAASLFMALGAGIAVLWVLRRWLGPPDDRWHPWAALRSIARAGIVAAWVFYLWSPLLFANQYGVQVSLRGYMDTRINGASVTAVEFWGKLGWLDYQLAGGWYALLWLLVLTNLACVVWRPRRPLTFAVFGAAVFLAYVGATLAGEYGFLSQAGFQLQGRYFLPAIAGLLAIALSHHVAPARYALLAGVIVVNLLLMQRTVTRYYADGWSGVTAALPFSRVR